MNASRRTTIRKHAAASRPIAAIALLLSLAGCTYRITPPANPASPTAIFLVDYGQHSSLLLPAESGELREYAYGEWEWFAKNREDWWRGPIILLFSAPGALGVRPAPFDESTLEAALNGPTTQPAREPGPAEGLHALRVDAARVADLRRRLDQSFESRTDAAHFNTRQSMLFVPADQRYSCLFHCNSATADWLRELGCGISGGGGLADFRVVAK